LITINIWEIDLDQENGVVEVDQLFLKKWEWAKLKYG
tara:strand:+ start:491 stop:601 length:111 start_codon:yes stop_codon:yes gene_type:complete